MKAILTKYHGPTNYKGSRYSATDGDTRVILSADDSLSSDANHDRAALALCTKLQWDGELVRGGLKNGNVYVFAEWPSDHIDLPKIQRHASADAKLLAAVGTRKRWRVI